MMNKYDKIILDLLAGKTLKLSIIELINLGMECTCRKLEIPIDTKSLSDGYVEVKLGGKDDGNQRSDRNN